jgi:ectoine hydroxylase-related dioxygenase (phytanoyl-CoA dioxygenase family)
MFHAADTRTGARPIDRCREQFREEGYFVLERVIPEEVVQMLREECAYFVGYMDGRMDALGQRTVDINHRGSRYFISKLYRNSARLSRFLFGALMAEVVEAALGPDVYLFNEQWVVKAAGTGMKFAWHQDSGYIAHEDPAARHAPYLTCWCPLDDVTEDNGAVYLLPHSRAGTRDTVLDHVRQEGSNDLVGYRGEEAGVAMTAPAGSIVCFSSHVLHRSAANRTSQVRRVYLAQYSKEPITAASGALWAMAVPFLRHGRIVYEPAGDTAERYGPLPRAGAAQ